MQELGRCELGGWRGQVLTSGSPPSETWKDPSGPHPMERRGALAARLSGLRGERGLAASLGSRLPHKHLPPVTGGPRSARRCLSFSGCSPTFSV